MEGKRKIEGRKEEYRGMEKRKQMEGEKWAKDWEKGHIEPEKRRQRNWKTRRPTNEKTRRQRHEEQRQSDKEQRQSDKGKDTDGHTVYSELSYSKWYFYQRVLLMAQKRVQ